MPSSSPSGPAPSASASSSRNRPSRDSSGSPYARLSGARSGKLKRSILQPRSRSDPWVQSVGAVGVGSRLAFRNSRQRSSTACGACAQWRWRHVPARALRAPHAGAARLAAGIAGATPLRAAGRCLSTLRLAPPQRRARARWAPPAIPTAKAAHQTSAHVEKGDRRWPPAGGLVSGEARHVTCRPTLDCSSASASALGMAPSRARWSCSGQGQWGTVLCIYSQTVDASQEHAVERWVVGNVAPQPGTAALEALAYHSSRSHKANAAGSISRSLDARSLSRARRASRLAPSTNPGLPPSATTAVTRSGRSTATCKASRAPRE
eukprot:scaffold9965_cov64-Phaeocystis_antarctica.AAC.8